VLALDGGGVKALFIAHVLARLEADLDVEVRDCFDLITGTSAGGIVALALGAGVRPAEIVEHYTKLAAVVFPSTRRRWWRWPARIMHTTYDPEPLQAALTDIFGQRTLLDSAKRLLVPAWDLHNGGVHIFKTPHHPRLRRDWRTSMVDVALATSAAPTFLPAAHVDGLRLVDGGLWAPNPSVLGIAEAFSMLDVPLHNIRVLNIGTTTDTARIPAALYDGGFGHWARHIAPVFTAANSRGAEGIAAHLLGPSNFRRFDVAVPDKLYRLDEADRDDLASVATRASRQLSPEFSATFAAHRATEYTPAFNPTPRNAPDRS
jgi:patatin-like phospholipase/acyl hydrolase